MRLLFCLAAFALVCSTAHGQFVYENINNGISTHLAKATEGGVTDDKTQALVNWAYIGGHELVMDTERNAAQGDSIAESDGKTLIRCGKNVAVGHGTETYVNTFQKVDTGVGAGKTADSGHYSLVQGEFESPQDFAGSVVAYTRMHLDYNDAKALDNIASITVDQYCGPIYHEVDWDSSSEVLVSYIDGIKYYEDDELSELEAVDVDWEEDGIYWLTHYNNSDAEANGTDPDRHHVLKMRYLCRLYPKSTR